MSQSARLRNLSPRVRLSTAITLSFPRALRARTRFDPMNPAAPVTTMYIASPLMCCGSPARALPGALELEVEPADVARHHRHARRQRAQELVAHGGGGGSHFVDRQAL